VTLSTVGYGDISPVTADGRLAATALMILGITLWAAITGTITSALVTSNAADGPSAASRLRDLDALHRDGIITPDEFATRRASLMDQL
jgi:voltage-gated potassium channel